MRDFTRYVDRLVRGRRPGKFAPTPDEAAALRAAIAIRAEDPEEPRPEFVAELRGRLAAASAPEQAPGGRRSLLVGTSAAAAAATIAVVVDRTLVGSAATAEPSTLDPADGGSWHTVLASSDLPGNGAAPFETSVVSGFVMRIGGVLSARSGTCTHQGCKLGLDAAEKRLACPCHRTFFAYDGTVVRSQLPHPPAPLPSFHVREFNGQIQILLPRDQ